MTKQRFSLGIIFLTLVVFSFRTRPLQIIVAVPSWKVSEESIATLPYDHITGLIWAFALPNTDGSIEVKYEEMLRLLAKQCKSKGKWLVLGVGGANGSEPFRDIVQSDKTSQHFAQQVKKLCDTYHLQGVQIDFEDWPGSQQVDTVLSLQFLNFGKILRSYLPATQYTIAYDVYGSDWYGKQFPSELSTYADRINIMAIDATGSWSEMGDPASMESAVSSIQYWKKRFKPEDHEKLTLVLPLYGKVFSKQHKKGMKVKSMSYKEIVETYGFIQQDSIALNDDILWYNSFTTLMKKKRYAEQENLYGISFWESSYDSPIDSMSVLKQIDQ